MNLKNLLPKEKDVKFLSFMKKKLVVLVLIVLLAFAGLCVRLILIGKENGEQYKKQIFSQMDYSSQTIPYKRGDILDRKGTTLATSTKVYNVILDTSVLKEASKGNIEPTLDALNTCFGLDKQTISEYIKTHEKSAYYVLARQLPYEDVQKFEDLKANAVKGSPICGIWFEEEYKRFYPYQALACDTIGFTVKGNEGSYGLEEYYNDILNGTDGRKYGYINDDLNLEQKMKPATDGNTLVSTIDANIQTIVEKYLYQFNEDHMNEYREGLGCNNSGCIIMEANTGNVLAMASYPNYDLNNPRDISKYYSEEAIQEMKDNDTYLDTLNALWKNFCINSTYEPGSVAKPFTVATGLDSGKMTGNETYQCNGYLEVGGWPIKCHNRYGDGEMTVASAIAQSCNVSLMYMGQSIGSDTFLKYFEEYNFGLKTNIDLTGEARTAGLVFNHDTMGPVELATSTFGQGYNVTMIQMITAFCSLINGGNYYEPHMVNKVLSADGAVIKNVEPRVLKQTISSSVSDKIVEYCNGVVTDGTGVTARPAGYAIGGKTGTAETSPRNTPNYVVSFMGYAPADDPQIAIYVVIDRPNVAKQDNARYATLLVHDILTEVLPYLNIFMTEELSEKEIEELKEKGMFSSIHIAEPEEEEQTDNPDGSIPSEDNGDDTDPNRENQTEDGGETKPKVEYDPETGYPLDPINGEPLDPVTGQPIDPASSGLPPTDNQPGLE